MKCGQVDKVHIMVRNTPRSLGLVLSCREQRRGFWENLQGHNGGEEDLTKRRGGGGSIFKETLEIRQRNLDLLGFHFLINT